MKKIIGIVAIVLTVCSSLLAQSDPDFMRSIGKIYVVVGTILIMFIGLVIFLILIERRLKNLENYLEK